MKNVYFDMDGTVYDLYNLPDWLVKLRNEISPFLDTESLVDIKTMAHLINVLKIQGNTFGIITWLPRDASERFEETCADDKAAILERDFGTDTFDTFEAIKFGTPKHTTVGRPLTREDVLIDDNWEVLSEWTEAGGTGVHASKLITYLYSILR